ncbi:MAG: LD-carboxypeptidase [Flavobacteriales bacterium]|nr:LD-carboxypeptidase [Flavobacteriales bacterium]MCB9365265.1 LD-carboxypeptidase [Flavobacteriales bacterium]
MQKPSNLKQGDKVALVSTARKLTMEELQLGVDKIKSWGLEPVLGKNLFAVDNQFAGTTEERTADFQEALDNPEIKAIICVRGGYGTVKIIDELDFTHFIKEPKWICGYSDVTVLHNHINQNFGIETLHSAMPLGFKDNTTEAIESLKETLFGETLTYSCDANELNVLGEAEGELVGGNLSIIYSLTGTKSQLNTKGKILFIEDLDEYLYHVDRMMMNLDRAGLLANLNGLVVGGMTDMNDNSVPYGKTAKEIIIDTVKRYNYPVCFDIPAGHLDDNRALIMGRKVLLKVTGRETELEFS